MMLHWGPRPIVVCSNNEIGLTLTCFMARSNLVVCVFEWGKLLNGHFMGNLQQMIKMTENLY